MQKSLGSQFDLLVVINVGIAPYEEDGTLEHGYSQYVRGVSIGCPPFIGLRIMDGDWQCPPIESIMFDVENDHFLCMVEMDTEVPDRFARTFPQYSHRNIDDYRRVKEWLVAEAQAKEYDYLKSGWVLQGPSVSEAYGLKRKG